MNTASYSHSILNETISRNNVKFMGEILALRAVKTVMLHSGNALNRLYHELIRDVFHPLDNGRSFSDGYDVAQTAICFLCEHIGKNLDDTYAINKRGKIITIKHACYTLVNRFIIHKRAEIYATVSIHDLNEHHQPAVPFESDTEQDYTALDETIRKMNLTDQENDTLSCYMSGMGTTETARFLSVSLSAVWHRRTAIQRKYQAVFQS